MSFWADWAKIIDVIVCVPVVVVPDQDDRVARKAADADGDLGMNEGVFGQSASHMALYVWNGFSTTRSPILNWAVG